MSALSRLAELHGIALDYHDVRGKLHTVAETTLRALLAAMDVAAATDPEVESSLAAGIAAQWREIVTDHCLARDLDAEPVELGGKEKGIGVDPVRGQQFRSDCDDFSFHFELAWKRKAFHVPIDGEERAACSQDGAVAGQ